MAKYLIVACFTWLALFPLYVIPCSCIPPAGGFPAQLEQCDGIFLGRVTSTRNVNGSEDYDYMATFEVIKIWKGLKKAEISVITSNSGSTCGVDFIPGRAYLVFSKNGGTNWCLGTKGAEGADRGLKLLGAPLWKNPKARDWQR